MTLIPENNINSHYRTITQTESSKRTELKNDDQKIQFEKLLRERGHGAKDMRSSDFLGNKVSGFSDLKSSESSGAQRFDETGVMGNSTEVEYSTTEKSDLGSRSSSVVQSQEPAQSISSQDSQTSIQNNLVAATTVTAETGDQSPVSKNISSPVTNTPPNNHLHQSPPLPEIQISSKQGDVGATNSKGDAKITSDSNAESTALKARITALIKSLKSAQSNPIQISILSDENGLKVKVKMPHLEMIDRHQLKKQISSLLSEHGYKNVEIEIQGPENGQVWEVERHT